jgi:hypothetical protein
MGAPFAGLEFDNALAHKIDFEVKASLFSTGFSPVHDSSNLPNCFARLCSGGIQ